MTTTLRDVALDGTGPTYAQIYRGLRRAILEGRAEPGLRLPATRALAGDLGVSRTTVLAAYEQLLAEGYAEARVGAGTFVAAQLPARAPRAGPPCRSGGCERSERHRQRGSSRTPLALGNERSRVRRRCAASRPR